MYSFTFQLRYEGDWKEGIKEGTGKFTYANGDVFTVNIIKIPEPFIITWPRDPMSGETATALVSLSRAMERREMRIIRRENSSTLLSPKVLSEQNIIVFLKLFNKLIMYHHVQDFLEERIEWAGVLIKTFEENWRALS